MYTARCTRCSHTQNRKNAQTTALPYRTVPAMGAGDGIASASFTNKRGALPCGAPPGLLVYARARSRCTCTAQPRENLTPPARDTGGIEHCCRRGCCCCCSGAVAFVLHYLIRSDRKYCNKLHARRGTRRGKLVFPFYLFVGIFLSFPSNTTAFFVSGFPLSFRY